MLEGKDVAEVLIAHGADVNAIGAAGLRPLDIALLAGRVETAKLLVCEAPRSTLRESTHHVSSKRRCGPTCPSWSTRYSSRDGHSRGSGHRISGAGG
jgi:hypothetical protein